MASITNDCIQIQGIDEPYLIHDFRLNITPNDHGHAMLNLEIVEDGKAENLLKSMENTMVIIKSTAKSNTGILFKGYMAGATISRQIDRVMVEIRLITATIQFDKKRSSSSFQKKELKYAEIFSDITAEDGGNCTYLDARIKSEVIGLPIIRYKESSWEFGKRLAARYWLPLVPDETADKPVFSLGIKTEGTAPESGFFKKGYQNFVHVGDFIGRKLMDKTGNRTMEDYTGMELRSYYNYKIGMSVTYGGKSGIICAKRAEMEQSELVFTYVVGTQELYAPEPTYHKHLHGRCLTGTVVKCENETVKLQLDIDEESGKIKSETDLYPFPWKPETGNLLYCMPEKDTVVSLYIGGPNEGEAIVINTLRKKNEKDTDKPENRYLTTTDHKRLYMKKKEIGFSVEDKDDGKTHFALQDDKGITFQTKGAITVQAKGRIEINGKTFTAEAKKVINLTQDKAQIGLRSKKVSITGTSVHLMPGVATPELAEAAYQQELKDMQAKDIETKSSAVMASGALAGSGDGKSKYLDQVDAIVALMEQDNRGKNATFDEMYEAYSRKGGEHKYNKKEIAGAYYKYTGQTDYLDEIDYQRILEDDGRPVSQKNVKEGEVKNHAHHICYKKGQEGVMNDIAMEGHEILRRYGIDPVLDPHNLVSAPNTGHSQENILKVVKQLKATEQKALSKSVRQGLEGEEQKEFVKQALYGSLDDLGEEAKEKPNKKKDRGNKT